MNDILRDVVGKKVEVRSESGAGDFRDEGTLVAYDERWIQLQKTNGEYLFFAIVNIRLLKPLS